MKSRRILATTLTIGALVALTACASPRGSDTSTSTDASCTPAAEFDTITPGKLTIAAPDSPPRFFGDPTAPEGIDPTLLTEFAAAMCLEPVWTVVPQPSVIETVGSGRADIAAGGWYRTEARGEVVGQSEPTLADIPTIVSAEESDSLDSFASLGTVTGFLWTDDLKAIFGDNLQLFQSTDAVVQAIADGRIEAGLFSGVDGPYLASKADADLVGTPMAPDDRVAASLNPGWVNYPFTKANTALGDALNQEIANWHENGFIEETLETFDINPILADTSKFEG